jgi:hypothetical protein
MASVIRFGGRNNLSKATSGAGALAPLLSRLSWKYVTDSPKYDPFQIDLVDETVFRNALMLWVGRFWIHDNSMPTGDALRTFNMMSLAREFRDFVATNGDGFLNEGLTLDECWGSAQLLHAQPVHMFVSKRFETELGKHVPAVFLHPQQLVWSLAAICLEFGFNRPTFPVLVTDGFDGHTIMMTGLSGIGYEHPRGQFVDGGWFSFHDPLPSRSFLALEQGFAGAGALEDVSRPPYWIISPDDLNKVVVGFALSKDRLNALRNVFMTLNAISASWVRVSARPRFEG